MTFLLTGGTGFIGSHVVDRLVEEGHTVKIIDRSIKHHNLRYPEKVSLYHENILGNIADLFKDVDVVLHMAALTRPQWSIKFPIETTEVNVSGTVKILQHCVDNKVKRFILLSTSAIYGDQKIYPTSEDAVANPMNTYALTKLIDEQYCQLFKKLYGLEWNAIRPFNAYGSRMPVTGIYTSAIATYVNALKQDIPFKMFGDGTQRRDFIYISDVVDQIIRMATSEVHGEVFNCGSGVNHSINEVLAIIRKIMKKQGSPERIPPQFEPSQTLADISKAERLLGWKPTVSLEEGLIKTIEATL